MWNKMAYSYFLVVFKSFWWSTSPWPLFSQVKFSTFSVFHFHQWDERFIYFFFLQNSRDSSCWYRCPSWSGFNSQWINMFFFSSHFCFSVLFCSFYFFFKHSVFWDSIWSFRAGINYRKGYPVWIDANC